MAGRTEPGVEEDSVAFLGVQGPPGLVCDGKFWENTAVVEEEGVGGCECLVGTGGVGWLGARGGGGAA